MSLASRLLWWAGLPLALLLLGAAWLTDLAFRNAVERGFDQQLAVALDRLGAALELGQRLPQLRREPDDGRYQQLHSGWYWQIEHAGTVWQRSRSLWDARLAIPAEWPAGQPLILDLHGPDGAPIRVQARELQGPGSRVRIAVAMPRSAIDAEIAGFSALLWPGLALLLLIFTVALYAQVRGGLAPLRRLGAELREMQAGRRESLPDSPVSEISDLVREINVVLAANRRLAGRGRKLAGDLAHALKTPLALVSSQLPQDSPASLRASLVRINELIQRHLAQAAADARREHASCEIKQVLERLIGMFDVLHRERQLRFLIQVPDQLCARCEADDLNEMLGNLIDNACRAARGEVQVIALAEGDQLQIQVIDDGAGLDDAALALLGRRGQRFDQGPGAGLGVSITQDIAESYAGSLSFSRNQGGGLTASLRLPRVIPPSRSPTKTAMSV